jgi:hypothetical protein
MVSFARAFGSGRSPRTNLSVSLCLRVLVVFFPSFENVGIDLLETDFVKPRDDIHNVPLGNDAVDQNRRQPMKHGTEFEIIHRVKQAADEFRVAS